MKEKNNSSSLSISNPEFKKYSNELAPNPESDQALRTCAISPQDFTHAVVRVDGMDINPTKLDRATTNFYNVTGTIQRCLGSLTLDLLLNIHLLCIFSSKNPKQTIVITLYQTISKTDFCIY